MTIIYFFACVLLTLAFVLLSAWLRKEVLKLRYEMENRAKMLREVCDGVVSFQREERAIYRKVIESVEDLKNGLVPDYEKAKSAADAVNNFNSGLAQIMNFDPMDAIKSQREKGGTK